MRRGSLSEGVLHFDAECRSWQPRCRPPFSMVEPSEAEDSGPVASPVEIALYIDSSALAKLYVPEAESERLDAFLRGRVGLMISELAITEVLSAVARRKREGELRPELANQIRDAVLTDADSGSFARLHLDPAVHREAERLLLTTISLPLRTLDALHLALAFSGAATHVLTFDHRMREAAVQSGLNVIDL
jgi:predicted nucleic acid-binding protein